MYFSQVSAGLDLHFPSLSFSVSDARYTLVTGEWNNSVFHSDLYARLYLIQEGRGRIVLDNEERELVPGSLYLIPPGTVYRHIPSNGLGHFWVHFTAELFGSLSLFDVYASTFAINPEHAVPGGLQAAHRMMTEVVRAKEELDRTEGKEPAAMLRLRSTLGYLLSFFIQARQEKDTRLRDLSRFAPVVAAIQSKLDRAITIGELADIAGMHPTYFANRFHGVFGSAPRRYIMVKRVEQAQRLLWSSEEPLKGIAASCGFDDLPYFSRVFRKITGVAPGTYRGMGRRIRT